MFESLGREKPEAQEVSGDLGGEPALHDSQTCPAGESAAAAGSLPAAEGPPAFDSWVEELDVSSAADAIADLERERRLLGARRFLLAVTWADQHVPACQQDRPRDAAELSGPRDPVCGCQESGSATAWQRRLRICRRPGSDGTPAVSASGVAEYAVHSGTTTMSGAQALGEALDLRHRHPRLWRRVMAGEVEEWQARRVVRMASWLTREEADEVDAATAHVVGKLPWGRCSDVVEAAVIAADPEGHEERRREHDERCYVSAGRYRGTDAKGNRTLVARTSASNVARLDALIQHLAELMGAAGDGDAEQVRRAKAIGLLANPAQVCVLLGETVTPDLISDVEPAQAPCPRGTPPTSTDPVSPTSPTSTSPAGSSSTPPSAPGHGAATPDTAPVMAPAPPRSGPRHRPGHGPRPSGPAPPDPDVRTGDPTGPGRRARPEREPELDHEPGRAEPEPEPDPEPPTAVQLAAEFGRVLSDLARQQGDRSAWDLLRPETTLVFHLSEDGVVARMSDASGPLGPVGLRQLRDLLSEQLPAWLVDHLNGEHPSRSRLVPAGDPPADDGGADRPPGGSPSDTGPPGQSPTGSRAPGTSTPETSTLETGTPGTSAPGTSAPGTSAPGTGADCVWDQCASR